MSKRNPTQSKIDSIPHFRKQANAIQLIVDEKPFLIIGGEIHNSSSSSIEYMKPIWQQMVDLNFNTLLTPVYWELIEPKENKFDFSLIDHLILEARRYNLRLIFLWFGSWKNGMSSYAPLWVKQDCSRFPRVKILNGKTVEILSPFSEQNWKADARAFGSLMHHIREVDSNNHTVLMMQVENEVGVLGDSKDLSNEAIEVFNSPVPKVLLDYLQKNKQHLVPEVRSCWETEGSRTTGTWQEIFGSREKTDDIFTAWGYARYIDQVTAAGKSEYNIPMYVNAWLNGPDTKPGDYPSGGPLPHTMDIWLAGAPHIDLLAPDIYAPNYEEWCRRYTQRGNPLFIPEMRRDDDGVRNIFYAFGQHDAIGTSPFAVDSSENPTDSILSKSYEILKQISPLILSHQGKGEMVGFVIDKEHSKVMRELGEYEMEITLDEVFSYRSDVGYGLIIMIGPNEFIGAGSGFRVTFRMKAAESTIIVGIGSIDEGQYCNGKWSPCRRLNGDENDQGRTWRFSNKKISIEHCVAYRCE